MLKASKVFQGIPKELLSIFVQEYSYQQDKVALKKSALQLQLKTRIWNLGKNRENTEDDVIPRGEYCNMPNFELEYV